MPACQSCVLELPLNKNLHRPDVMYITCMLSGNTYKLPGFPIFAVSDAVMAFVLPGGQSDCELDSAVSEALAVVTSSEPIHLWPWLVAPLHSALALLQSVLAPVNNNNKLSKDCITPPLHLHTASFCSVRLWFMQECTAEEPSDVGGNAAGAHGWLFFWLQCQQLAPGMVHAIDAAGFAAAAAAGQLEALLEREQLI